MSRGEPSRCSAGTPHPPALTACLIGRSPRAIAAAVRSRRAASPGRRRLDPCRPGWPVSGPQGPYFEVAIIHHTDSGSTLLADDELRHRFAQRIGADERTLADTPVLDPARTVTTDVNRVLWAEELPQNVHVSGHVYDIDTGLVTTIVDAKARK